VGVRAGPKSALGGDDEEGGGEKATGYDAIAKYGVGDPDPETGIYAVYDIPEEVIEPKVAVLELVEDWTLVVADFASEYSIRLAVTDMTWREFVTLLTGLLSNSDTRLYRLASRKQQED
jgi:hypothetical protein